MEGEARPLFWSRKWKWNFACRRKVTQYQYTCCVLKSQPSFSSSTFLSAPNNPFLTPSFSEPKTLILALRSPPPPESATIKELNMIKVPLFCLLSPLFVALACCDSDVRVGYRVTMAVPVEYGEGFVGRAFLMETNQVEPNFKAALSVEARNGRHTCSLEVFLGDVKVWNSGHYSKFYTSDICILQLTQDGDLQLKGTKDRVGWRTGTSGQGVERLQMLNTGNLVLVDALNRIKWQSFNFPTDVMLWGQRLNVATRLTSFPSNSSVSYTFEIKHDRIALYLNSGKWNYSYWEFKPSKNRNITFLELGSQGLELFNDQSKKIAQIPSTRVHPLRFLALANKTGNLGLYYYSPSKDRFEAAFQAINSTCDLPLPCKPYGICTFSNTCSCIGLLMKDGMASDCSAGYSGSSCGNGHQVEMLELNGVSSVLKDAPKRVNVSKEACSNFCLKDCKCVAALYSSSGECFLYGVAMGVKQVPKETGLTYMVKVPKGARGSQGKADVKRWVLIVVGAADALVVLLVLGGLGFYLVRRRRKNLPAPDPDNDT